MQTVMHQICIVCMSIYRSMELLLCTHIYGLLCYKTRGQHCPHRCPSALAPPYEYPPPVDVAATMASVDGVFFLPCSDSLVS